MAAIIKDIQEIGNQIRTEFDDGVTVTMAITSEGVSIKITRNDETRVAFLTYGGQESQLRETDRPYLNAVSLDWVLDC